MVAQTGSCLCGAVRYRLAEPPKGLGACHCGMCRKFSGGIELGIEVPAGGVVFETDETLRTYTSSDWAERGFCATCGSSLYWRLTAPGPMHGLYAVAAGTLDSLDGLELTQEVYIDHKPAGYALTGDHTRLTEADIMAMVAAAQEGETP
ncbi:GFA family protein [Dinoroseobacter sp. S76]|uniref:GFA family protein n=1 Tax=Dinoroseobacter sp. S76 TaxID=3415124 RepID=UPI003C7ABD3C